MKRLGKEEVIEESYLDGKLLRSTTTKKTIYLNNGEEVVYYVTGYRKIERLDGKAVLKIMARSVTATPRPTILRFSE